MDAMNDTREQLAAYAHEAWAGWTKYMFEKGDYRPVELEGGAQALEWVMPVAGVQRWSRQMNTAYEDLPESEKESDRLEADKMLAIVDNKCMCGCAPCKYCDGLLEP